MSLGCFGKEVGAGVLLSLVALGFGVEPSPREQGAQNCRQEDPSVGIEVSGNSRQLFQGRARKSGVKSK